MTRLIYELDPSRPYELIDEKRIWVNNTPEEVLHYAYNHMLSAIDFRE